MVTGTARVHHVVFQVTDLDRAVRYYEDVIGWKSVGELSWFRLKPNVGFRSDAGQFMILVPAPGVRPTMRKAHTGIAVGLEELRDIRERVRRAYEHGPKSDDIYQNLSDTRLGGRSATESAVYFRDPDGNRMQATKWEDPEYTVRASGRGRIDAGPIESFAVNSVTYNREGRFFVVRTRRGFLALNEACTHQQCRIAYQPEHYRYFCSCHGRTFTRTGEVVGHDWGRYLDTPPLHAYALSFENGHVMVNTDVSLPRSEDQVDEVVPLPERAAGD